MQLRRPLATLATALALFGGAATVAACGSPATPDEGTTEDSGSEQTLSPEEADRENLPNIHDAEEGNDDDTHDPD
ncbi:hypothetical protein [Geodermatophilus marinus]|uniref:hypothetical protein n=1 Tax=Geodermatophilus sp. LHW52908 TaxID=2303986 RepID=UPI000E3DE96B|nr:hypothetical protein [Geodermatophilus sp. LHW52908]RFU20747.1 hypothetical protein D0Z06_14425 [Geodermatophilus sp. LHW52908]